MERVYSVKKIKYCEKLVSLLESNTGILVVNANHVGSYQIQQIRAALRGRAEVLMGKNTQIRRVMRIVAEDFPNLNKLLPFVQGNVGLVFTNENIKDIRDILVSYKVPAAAKTGVIAPVDVFVPPGPTGLDPGQTSFFQSLGIATKIVRGSIEMLNQVHLIKKGAKVGNSETALLAKLSIRPFAYGLKMVQIYDFGSVYDEAVLDMSDNDVMMKFFNGLGKIAAIGLHIGIPSFATIPHSLINGLKKLIAVAVETEFSFEQAEQIKAYLADPSAFIVDEIKEAPKGDDNTGGDAAADDDDDDDNDSDGSFGGGLFGAESDSDSDS